MEIYSIIIMLHTHRIWRNSDSLDPIFWFVLVIWIKCFRYTFDLCFERKCLPSCVAPSFWVICPGDSWLFHPPILIQDLLLGSYFCPTLKWPRVFHTRFSQSQLLRSHRVDISHLHRCIQLHRHFFFKCKCTCKNTSVSVHFDLNGDGTRPQWMSIQCENQVLSYQLDFDLTA